MQLITVRPLQVFLSALLISLFFIAPLAPAMSYDAADGGTNDADGGQGDGDGEADSDTDTDTKSGEGDYGGKDEGEKNADPTKDSPDNNGNGKPDNEDKGQAEKDAQDVAADAHAKGVGVDVGSVDISDAGNLGKVSLDGKSVTKDAATKAIDATASLDKSVQGTIDIAATAEAYDQGVAKPGEVVSDNGFIGSPDEVAAMEIEYAREVEATAMARAFGNTVAGLVSETATAVLGDNLTDALAAAADIASKVPSVNAMPTATEINDYLGRVEYANSLMASGNVNLSGTTNTSFTYDPQTNTWTGKQNGMSLTTADMMSRFGYTSEDYGTTFAEDAAKAAKMGVSVSIDFARDTLTALDTTTGSVYNQNLTTRKTSIEKTITPGTYNALSDLTKSSLLGSYVADTSKLSSVTTARSFVATDLGQYTTVTSKPSFVGANLTGTPLTGTEALSRIGDKIGLKDDENDLEGVKDTTIDAVLRMADDCGCKPNITSGTDNSPTDPHAPSVNGSLSHLTGDKVDISFKRDDGQQFSDYMKDPANGWSVTSQRKNGDDSYTNPDFPGVTATEEIDHWDVSVRADKYQDGRSYGVSFGGVTDQDSMYSDVPDGYSLSGGVGKVPDKPSTDTDNNDTPVASVGDDDSQTGKETGGVIGRVVGDAVCGGVCGTIGTKIGGWLGSRLSGLEWTGGTYTPNTGGGSHSTSTCNFYPVQGCNQSGSIISAVSGLSAFFSNWWNAKEPVISKASAEEPYVLVNIVINDQTQQIDISRPDIEAAMANSASYSSDEQEEMKKLLSETPILFGNNGTIVYSNGLYSPPVKDGQLTDGNAPRYVYTLEKVNDQGVSVTPLDSESSDGVMDQFIRYVFGNSSPFGIREVNEVTYRLVDPDPQTDRDEYYDYVIRLHDGERGITIPQYSSIETMTERFGLIGYEGSALELLAMAKETSVTPQLGLISRLMAAAGNAVDFFMNPDGDSNTDYTDLTATVTESKFTIDNVERIFIYPNAEVSCYGNIAGYENGFMYSAMVRDINDPNYLWVITDGRCGAGGVKEYVEEVSNRLSDTYGIKNSDYQSVLDKSYIREEVVGYKSSVTKVYSPRDNEIPEVTTEVPTTGTSTPVVEPDSEKLPNTTNTVSFEVKAVGSGGNVLADWTNSSSLTITEGVQLYFRWNASDYQQCLPFLQDNGNYSLTRSNRAMTSGNTESESYDVTEKTATYRLECGGQKNKEIGVDAREIGVVVK